MNVANNTNMIHKIKQAFNVTELRLLLKHWIVFRCFIPSFSRISTLHERKLKEK